MPEGHNAHVSNQISVRILCPVNQSFCSYTLLARCPGCTTKNGSLCFMCLYRLALSILLKPRWLCRHKSWRSWSSRLCCMVVITNVSEDRLHLQESVPHTRLQCHNPQHHDRHLHHCKNSKSQIHLRVVTTEVNIKYQVK